MARTPPGAPGGSGGGRRRVRRSTLPSTTAAGDAMHTVVLPDGRRTLAVAGSGAGRRPRRPRARRRLWVAVALVGVAVVLALGVAAALVAKRPGVRTRLDAASGGRLKPLAKRVLALLPAGQASSEVVAVAARRPPAKLACTPAVPAGTAAEPHDLARLGAGERATVLWQWADTVRRAAAERRALQAAAQARGVATTAVGRRGAVAATATGDVLRGLGAQAPSATAVTAVPDSRTLCVLD